MAIAEADKAIARTAAAAFGGRPRVDRYYDELETTAIDLLACDGRPAAGFTSYSTIGLHRAKNLLDGRLIPVEMAGVAATAAEKFANVLATAALNVMKDGWLCAPGVVFDGLLSEYGLSDTLEHVLWTPPFPWEELAEVPISPELDVHWLVAVPISESERRLLVEQGFDKLDALLSEHEVAYFDLTRASLA